MDARGNSLVFMALGRVLETQAQLAELTETYRRLLADEAGPITYAACFDGVTLPLDSPSPGDQETLRGQVADLLFQEICNVCLALVKPLEELTDAILALRGDEAAAVLDTVAATINAGEEL